MTTITTSASSAPFAGARPQPANPEGRQAVKDLTVALKNGDLAAAKTAYAQMIRSAPEGTNWNTTGPVADVGRALVQGDVVAAKEIAKAALQTLKPERPLSTTPGEPSTPKTVSTTGGTAGTLLNVVA